MAESLTEIMREYRKQLQKGHIQKGYRALMGYMLDLKTHFKTKYPDYQISGDLYHGFMDMTYFAFSPSSFKQHRLKVAVVFNFDHFRFEVWLAGYNKRVQQKYWKLFTVSAWQKHRVVPSLKGVDSIVEFVLADEPDFSNPEALTRQIETRTMDFISDIQKFLSGIVPG